MTNPAPSPSVSHLSKRAQAAIDAGRAQAEAVHATAQPATVAPDTIQTWPAQDHGSRPYATGPAARTSAGVYTYTVRSGDVSSVIAMRFGLCDVDIVDASSSYEIQPGDVLTIERRMTEPDADPLDQDHTHEGWECNYPG